ncbi:hypothetical protein, partial [Escherichia coli]|uniref:hypothetical protein n=2 Tax=Bacteria TaxID=2 RepID=UPI001AA163EB
MASVDAERDWELRPHPDGRVATASPAAGQESDTWEPPSQRSIWLPLLLALSWMLGTFAVFWLSELD